MPHNHRHTKAVELSAEELVQQGLKRLKASGYKMTKKREEILQIFAEDQRYLSAKYIHEKLTEHYPTMSYNTTYRNIYDFVTEGLLEATEFNQEQVFKINCWVCDEHDDHHHHHHFICTSCGTTILLDACPMDHIHTDLSGVIVESHRFEVFGKCAKCAQLVK